MRKATTNYLDSLTGDDDVARQIHYLQSSHAETKLRAVEQLAVLDDPSCIPAMLIAAGTATADNIEVRTAVVQAIARMGDSGRGALAALTGDSVHWSATIRAEAARILGIVGDSNALPALARALRDKEARVRVQAAWALGTISDPAAVAALIEALCGRDKDWPGEIVQALGKIGDPRAIPAIVAIMRRGRSFPKRESIIPEALLGIARRNPVRELIVARRLLLSMARGRRFPADHPCVVAIREIEQITAPLLRAPIPASATSASPDILPIPAIGRYRGPENLPLACPSAQAP